MSKELPTNHLEALDVQVRESVGGGTVIHLLQDGDIISFRPSEWKHVRAEVEAKLEAWTRSLAV